jgi:hypothetical protein
MSGKNGYFLFDRERWLNSEIVKSRILTLLVFHFTTNATWKETEIVWNGAKRIIPAGSVLFGYGDLAKLWKESKGALFRGTQMLRKWNVIEYESGTHGTLVTLCNWKEIQSCENAVGTQMERKWNADGTQVGPYELRSKKQETKKEETMGELFEISISEKNVPARKKLSPMKENGEKGVRDFIGIYVKSFQSRYGDHARPDLGGKVQGQIKSLLKGMPYDRACQMIQVYLQMEVPWFNTKCHDISTFIQNLNPIGIALDTGQNQSTGTNWDKIKKELNIES